MSGTVERETHPISPVEWLPSGPRLANLSPEEQAELAKEVAMIEADKSMLMGH